jgi:hypothetical protein
MKKAKDKETHRERESESESESESEREKERDYIILCKQTVFHKVLIASSHSIIRSTSHD